jgi:hypothetical protein
LDAPTVDGPDHERQRADDRAEVPQERQPRVRRGQAERVRMLQYFQPEHRRDDHLPG